MAAFDYRGNELYCEGVAIAAIAEATGTPVYVYSRGEIERAYRDFDAALAGIPHEVCYAVKANSTLGVLGVLVQLGAGADIVSVGELYRWLRAGGSAEHVVFSGVGKTASEMKTALEAGIGCFNVESAEELDVLDQIARGLGKRAPISVRVNPDVDPQTHPYISTGLKQNKFGVAMAEAPALFAEAARRTGLEVIGVDFHIGSQLTKTAPFTDAIARLVALVQSLAKAGVKLRHVDIGGGLGIDYTALPSGSAAPPGQAPARDYTALPSGSAAPPGQAPARDYTALPSGSAAPPGQAPARDYTALPSGSAAPPGQAPARDYTALPSGSAAPPGQAPARGYEKGESIPSPADYGAAVRAALAPLTSLGITLVTEPGRAIVGAAGALISRVLYRKHNEAKHFTIVDAAMNDLMRPALYNSYHPIWPVIAPERPPIATDVVGPICETGDFFARDRALPALDAGELVWIGAAGAYGAAMSSNYNTRPRAAEVLVSGDRFSVIRPRETYEQLVANERLA